MKFVLRKLITLTLAFSLEHIVHSTIISFSFPKSIKKLNPLVFLHT